MSIAAAACVCAIESMEYWDEGVEVPGVKIVEALLLELTEGARSKRFMLPVLAMVGRPGDMALRRGGDTGIRGSMTRFEVLSIRGVLKRVGGRKGE